jgi:hypothetical protein
MVAFKLRSLYSRGKTADTIKLETLFLQLICTCWREKSLPLPGIATIVQAVISQFTSCPYYMLINYTVLLIKLFSILDLLLVICDLLNFPNNHRHRNWSFISYICPYVLDVCLLDIFWTHVANKHSRFLCRFMDAESESKHLNCSVFSPT